jgi:serine/threonine protein kinase/Tol biopolymer transport system component
MTPDRWQKVQELLAAATELEPASRGEFLDEACRGDPELRAEVDSLLSSLEKAPMGFLESPAIDAVPGQLPTSPKTASPSLVRGARLGPYEIYDLLGAGGMGEVYRAKDTRLNREVAVKILPRSFVQNPAAVARFEREAQAIAAMSHPNIRSIHDFGKQGDILYSVGELLQGQTLQERLAGGALPGRKAVEVALAIAQGLSAAHEKGIVHRDLKPANVFLTHDGGVKLLDFGLAKVILSHQGSSPDAPTEQLATEPGVVMGTVGYMSPEQVRGKPIDYRSDIFSFGAILYEMLSGHRAFRGDSAAETMAEILKEDPPDLATTTPTVSPALERVIRHCLEKNPEQRFQSARDLAFHLDALWSVSAPVAARPRGELPHRHWLLFGVAGVLAAVVIASLVWRLPASRSAEPARYHQLTFRRGTILTARFSKDGQSIVYGAAWEGEPFRVFSMRAESPESAAVAIPPADVLSVSTSEELALSLNRRFVFGWISDGTLARAPFAGGAPRELLERVMEAEWALDGSLAVIRRVKGGQTRLEWPEGRVLFQTPGWISHPRFSPDGSRIAFIDHPVYGDDRGAVAVVRVGEASRRLTPVYDSAQGVAWAPNSREVWFSASEEGANAALRAVTLAGSARTVARAPGRLRLLDISRAGRVLVARESSVNSVFVRGPAGREERDLSWLDRSTSRDLSADGAQLLLYEEGEGAGARPSVYVRRTDGSPAVRLGDGVGTMLSADGKWVVAIVFGSPPGLSLIPTGPGEPKLIPRGQIDEYHWARLLPDGRRVVISGNEKGRGVRLFVQEIDGAKARPITPEGTAFLLPPSPDGKFVPSAAPDGVKLFPIDGGEPRLLPNVERGDEILLWSADGRSVLVQRRFTLPVRIDRVDVATGKAVLWREIAPTDRTGMTNVTSVRISADEGALSYTVQRLLSELYLVDGLK